MASGKGGTGKTTVASSLALVWDRPVQAVDLDVEEPNLHLFLHPRWEGREPAYITVPKADPDLCNDCRACSQLCQFKAVTVLAGLVMTFPDMCHGCGGCLDVCPTGALTEDRRELGEITWGTAGPDQDVGFLMGRLRVGEALSPPLIRQVQDRFAATGDVIADAPPGASCPAVAAAARADVIVLVSEPTPFGLYDLKLAREALGSAGVPMGLVINRADLGNRAMHDYCRDTGLPILQEIPFSRELAAWYASGRPAAELGPQWRDLFVELAGRIKGLADGAGNEAACA